MLEILKVVAGVIGIVACAVVALGVLFFILDSLPSNVRQNEQYKIKRSAPSWCKHYGHEKTWNYGVDIYCWICGKRWDFVLKEKGESK